MRTSREQGSKAQQEAGADQESSRAKPFGRGIVVTPPGQTAPSWTASGRRHGTEDRKGKDEMDA